MPRSDPDLSAQAPRQRTLRVNVSISFAVPQITEPGYEFLAPRVLSLWGILMLLKTARAVGLTPKLPSWNTVPALLLMRPRTPD